MANEHLSNDVFRWRVIHSLCAVVRVVNELRNAVNLVQQVRAAAGEDPYAVDGFPVDVLEHVQSLCDLLQVLDKSVPVHRVQRTRAPRAPAPDVSRETSPDTERSSEEYPF